ncbi:hypothetical protein KR52_08225 [Synechococcus sp. KORDI-52]|uniref:hypothetical protein n=1 Tax=Synechococcus sp. KORDI-52 TaxID=585425 RepID=UPI0004E03975|nr:hypothetical protein [Synechococcus sp. KORDI-52]AII49126.1 hypothetical protein KR52_08225 [Synechococcus sp. KORDI-52]
MTRRLLMLMGMACTAVLAQQQLLLRQRPRLINLVPQQVQSGSAALDLQFSRPMDRLSVSEATRLKPAIPHQWLGEATPLRMVLDADAVLEGPIELFLAGEDQRELPLARQQWWWDPRPWLMATKPVEGGEQLQLQTRSEGWIPISRVWPAILSVVPLGNGEGIAMVVQNQNGTEQVWWEQLRPRSIASSQATLGAPTRRNTEPLLKREVLFAHLSSNLNGDLLVQSGGFRPGSHQVLLVQADGQRRTLDLKPSGPMQLLPAGGGVVMPTSNGLTLRALETSEQQPQILPGSRELGAFCGASGRAVLIRHWPDYRRSIELVVPGQAPKQLHLGDQAVLGVACDNRGERIWAVLGRWEQHSGQHELVLISAEGELTQRKALAPWTLKAGGPVQWNPVTNQLLMTLTQPEQADARAGLFDADSLQIIKVLSAPIGEAQWLPAG